MPDRYDFDHLPNQGVVVVRCIHCLEGGPTHKWKERRRRRHWQRHEANRQLQISHQRHVALRLAREARDAKG